MIAGLECILIGALLTWVAWRHWRYRKQETISILEAAMLKVGDEEPLPRTGLDRFLTYLQAILGFVLGPFFFFIGIVVLAGELELL